MCWFVWVGERPEGAKPGRRYRKQRGLRHNDASPEPQWNVPPRRPPAMQIYNRHRRRARRRGTAVYSECHRDRLPNMRRARPALLLFRRAAGC